MQNQAAEKIKDNLKIPDVLTYYGYSVSRMRRIPCPLHRGVDSNFCYTDKVFHCWTCGEHGDVISLAMKLFGLSFGAAMMKLNEDFNLGITNRKPTYRERQMARENKAVDKSFDEWQKTRENEYKGLSVVFRRIWQLKQAENYDGSLDWLADKLETYLDENIDGVVVEWQ